MAEPLLRVEHLRKVFAGHGSADEFVAVDDVSFELAAGRSLAILGESGSGKTTVARMLVGLTTPSAGRIELAGADRTVPARRAGERRARARDIQIVFQDPYSSLDRRQTVAASIEEMVRLHFSLSAAERRMRVRALGEQVGLDARQMDARPRVLSGGQRQRVAIARALAAEPRLLVLDESVASLDVSIQAQILNLLADIREQTSIAFVFISHDLAAVRQVTDDAIVMRRGEVVERGTTERVLDQPEHPYTRLLRASVPRRDWKPSRRGAAAPV